MPKFLSRLVPALIFGIFLYTGYLVLTGHYVPEPPVKSLKNWQDADAPLGFPVTVNGETKVQKFNPQFNFHTPFERAAIPRAPRFDAAMGTENAALTYNAQKFWEMNDSRGGHHTGDDLNGIGGQHSDLGDPVYAVANGLVIYAGEPSPGWGNTVILAHRSEDGRILHSMYAHLNEILATYGSYVARGDEIGTVGTANNNYLAHLHLEMREADGISPQRGYTAFQFDRLDPEKTISELRGAKADALNPSVLRIMRDEERKQRLQNLPAMDAESTLKLQEFLNKKEKE
ncbi:Peptidase family M23 [Rubritalea squalenifaciens DSM 18772]|uniref:Peptidase family M23 n=1 Tax=Rubritalea squalenifaciens DSM 18772 TaxID=1123071 RepID=A0A1M6D9G4_9BACT|nr:M23 family metallopeptidase [Rubritalea squalenifaciens]SHI69834.1 Peptidase family M23 [Rubritalea squalenifaciens DSM 18772]